MAGIGVTGGVVAIKNRKRMAAVQRAAGGGWKVVEAEVAAGRLTIRSARTHAGGAPPLNGSDVLLVAGSDRSLCRLMDLPAASDEQTRRMVALRLETELPYAVAESAWVCERLPAGAADTGRVLVVASPSADIAQAEKDLGMPVRRCAAVALDAAALAEVAAALGGETTCALAEIGAGRTTLVIVQAGRLTYMRRLFAGAKERRGQPVADAPAALAEEIDQCIHAYCLNAGAPAPSRLWLTGAEGRTDALRDILAGRVEIPAEIAPLPEGLDAAGDGAEGGRLLAEYPECVGALLAWRRLRQGAAPAAPPLRRRKPRLREHVRVRQAALAGLVVALLAGFIGMKFHVRRSRIESATRLARQGQPLLQDLDRLQREVSILETELPLRRPMIDSLSALVEALPPSLRIASITIDPAGQVTIAGSCQSMEEASEKAVSALRASPAFAGAEFLGASRESNEIRFRITCKLRRPSGGNQP